jgi:hypothetical protein
MRSWETFFFEEREESNQFLVASRNST